LAWLTGSRRSYTAAGEVGTIGGQEDAGDGNDAPLVGRLQAQADFGHRLLPSVIKRF
jgi:hypothetical protein